jgi:hypothetical protein
MEGQIKFENNQRFIYREAWDNGSGYVEGPGWYPYPVTQQEILQGMVDVQFREDMEVMENGQG